MSIILG